MTVEDRRRSLEPIEKIAARRSRGFPRMYCQNRQPYNLGDTRRSTFSNQYPRTSRTAGRGNGAKISGHLSLGPNSSFTAGRFGGERQRVVALELPGSPGWRRAPTDWSNFHTGTGAPGALARPRPPSVNTGSVPSGGQRCVHNGCFGTFRDGTIIHGRTGIKALRFLR